MKIKLILIILLLFVLFLNFFSYENFNILEIKKNKIDRLNYVKDLYINELDKQIREEDKSKIAANLSDVDIDNHIGNMYSLKKNKILLSLYYNSRNVNSYYYYDNKKNSVNKYIADKANELRNKYYNSFNEVKADKNRYKGEEPNNNFKEECLYNDDFKKFENVEEEIDTFYKFVQNEMHNRVANYQEGKAWNLIQHEYFSNVNSYLHNKMCIVEEVDCEDNMETCNDKKSIIIRLKDDKYTPVKPDYKGEEEIECIYEKYLKGNVMDIFSFNTCISSEKDGSLYGEVSLFGTEQGLKHTAGIDFLKPNVNYSQSALGVESGITNFGYSGIDVKVFGLEVGTSSFKKKYVKPPTRECPTLPQDYIASIYDLKKDVITQNDIAHDFMVLKNKINISPIYLLNRLFKSKYQIIEEKESKSFPRSENFINKLPQVVLTFHKPTKVIDGISEIGDDILEFKYDGIYSMNDKDYPVAVNNLLKFIQEKVDEHLEIKENIDGGDLGENAENKKKYHCKIIHKKTTYTSPTEHFDLIPKGTSKYPLYINYKMWKCKHCAMFVKDFS